MTGRSAVETVHCTVSTGFIVCGAAHAAYFGGDVVSARREHIVVGDNH